MVAVVVIALVVSHWAFSHDDDVWRAHVPGARALADIDGQRILVQTDTGYVVLARSTGHVVTRFAASGRYDVKRAMLVAHGDVAVQAVRRTDGGPAWYAVFDAQAHPVWRHQASPEVDSSDFDGLSPDRSRLIVTDATVRGQTVRGLAASSGRTVWQHPGYAMFDEFNPHTLLPRVAVPDDANTHDVVLLSPLDGRVLSGHRSPRPGSCAAQETDGGTVVRLHWGTTAQPRHCHLTNPIGHRYGTLVGTDGARSPSERGHAYAVDLRTGQVRDLHLTDFADSLESALGDHRQDAVVGYSTSDDVLHVYDAATGSLTWSHKWTRDGEVVSGSSNRRIVTVRRPTGWESHLGRVPSNGYVFELRDEHGQVVARMHQHDRKAPGWDAVVAGDAAIVVCGDDVELLR